MGRARVWQGVALRKLGKPKDALAALDEAGKIFAAAGDRNGVAMLSTVS